MCDEWKLDLLKLRERFNYQTFWWQFCFDIVVYIIGHYYQKQIIEPFLYQYSHLLQYLKKLGYKRSSTHKQNYNFEKNTINYFFLPVINQFFINK